MTAAVATLGAIARDRATVEAMAANRDFIFHRVDNAGDVPKFFSLTVPGTDRFMMLLPS
jgi:flavin reductase (DIM6/NTAB) family NADH-FMN oxidoreductase RutF